MFSRRASSGRKTGSHKSSYTKGSSKKKWAKKIVISDTEPQKYSYDFDWDLEGDYWFTKEELKSFNTVRFKDAQYLRKERDIKVASRDDADGLTGRNRNEFIGDSITHALDDKDTDENVSVQGIEHFVWPVLQKEMVARKKELKRTVLEHSHNPQMKRLDPQGEKLAARTAEQSKWAREVAMERGMKYCAMKRGSGRGGAGLLSLTKSSRMDKGRRSLKLG